MFLSVQKLWGRRSWSRISGLKLQLPILPSPPKKLKNKRKQKSWHLVLLNSQLGRNRGGGLGWGLDKPGSLRFSHAERFPGGSVVKSPPAIVEDTRDTAFIPGSERCLRGGNGNPLQYSCWDNPMERGARLATVHGVAKSWSAEAKVVFLGLPPTKMMH